MLGKYTIQIQAIDDVTEEVIYKGETSQLEIAEQLLNKVERQIVEYERLTWSKCSQCNKDFRIDEMSEPDDPDWEDKLVCQDCLEKIMNGEQKLKS